jgi:HK97 family phage portal protein
MGLLSNIGRIIKSAAMSPADSRGGWFSLWGTIREAFSGDWQRNIQHYRHSALHYSPVFACMTLIAGDISKLEWCIKIKDSVNDIWVNAPKQKATPYLNVLRRPNGFQNHIQFKELWLLSKLSHGNTYVLKGRDRAGRVNALYILDPTRVVPLIVDETGEVYYQLATDNMAGGLLVNSVTIPAREIIHDRFNCLFHPLVGLSPLFASVLPALQGIKIQENYFEFFKNGAKPSGVLTAPGSIKADTAATLKKQFDEGFTGENAGKTAVLADGLKYTPLTMSAVDSQVIDQLKLNTEQICSTFHVPQYKIGAGQQPSFQNIESLAQDYYSTCLQKHIEDMELCIDEGLEIVDETYAQLDLDGLLRMDQESLIKAMGEGVKQTLIKPNEGRRRLNLPPVEGGDVVLSQQQNYSLAALAKRDALPDPFVQTKPTTVPAGNPSQDGLDPNATPAADPNNQDKSAKEMEFQFTKALEIFDLEMA